MTAEVHQRELHCNYCGASIYFDDNRVSRKTGKKYPMDPGTGARHQCQEFYDAVKEKIAEQVKKEYAAYRQHSKENAERSKKERFIHRKAKIRTVVQKPKDHAISVNENSGEDIPIIEYRPPDFREW
jgi:hypothetical protein